jgi:hypothetical protein
MSVDQVKGVVPYSPANLYNGFEVIPAPLSLNHMIYNIMPFLPERFSLFPYNGRQPVVGISAADEKDAQGPVIHRVESG